MKKTGLFLILTIFLTGCFGGFSPTPKFYTLTTGQPTAVFNKPTFSVCLDDITLPRYLDRPQIVTGTTDKSELTVSEMNRWIEPLDNLISRTVVSDLSQIFPNATIKTRTTVREKFDYTISLDIVQMDAVFNQSANLTAWWTIQQGNKSPTRKKFTKALPVGSTYDDIATTQSQLFADLSEQIGKVLSGE